MSSSDTSISSAIWTCDALMASPPVGLIRRPPARRAASARQGRAAGERQAVLPRPSERRSHGAGWRIPAGGRCTPASAGTVRPSARPAVSSGRDIGFEKALRSAVRVPSRGCGDWLLGGHEHVPEAGRAADRREVSKPHSVASRRCRAPTHGAICCPRKPGTRDGQAVERRTPRRTSSEVEWIPSSGRRIWIGGTRRTRVVRAGWQSRRVRELTASVHVGPIGAILPVRLCSIERASPLTSCSVKSLAGHMTPPRGGSGQIWAECSWNGPLGLSKVCEVVP